MRTRFKSRSSLGFTLIELLVSIGIIGLLAAIAVAGLARAKAKARSLQCVGNLRQIGIGFRAFAEEHDGRYPADVRERYGGVMESVANVGASQHFKAISDAIDSTELLVCPSDRDRESAEWDKLTDANVSYLVGIDADQSNPFHILSADRNITIRPQPRHPIVWVTTNSIVEWTEELHGMEGNILFADGRVETADNGELLEAVRQHKESN